MQLDEIVGFFRVRKQTLSVSAGSAMLYSLAESNVKFSLTSKCDSAQPFYWLLTYSSRRDGSPFMNMLMIAPLCDSRGKIRYHIGAQVDVSGLAKDCTDLESLQKLVNQQQAQRQDGNAINGDVQQEKGDEFQELSEMLNMGELDTVRRHGGRMHREYQDDETESQRNTALHRPRLLLEEPSTDPTQAHVPGRGRSGKLRGIYQNVGFNPKR